MKNFVTPRCAYFSAPSAPDSFSYIVITPSESHGPKIALTWSSPQQKNGMIRNYTVFYSHSEHSQNVHTKKFGPNTFNYTVDALGGVSYQLKVRAVTIKPGPEASASAVIPEYGKDHF